MTSKHSTNWIEKRDFSLESKGSSSYLMMREPREGVRVDINFSVFIVFFAYLLYNVEFLLGYISLFIFCVCVDLPGDMKISPLGMLWRLCCTTKALDLDQRVHSGGFYHMESEQSSNPRNL